MLIFLDVTIFTKITHVLINQLAIQFNNTVDAYNLGAANNKDNVPLLAKINQVLFR